MTRILLLNGPNLSQLGRREPEQYGVETLQDIVTAAGDRAAELGAELEQLQSEHEGELVARVHAALEDGTQAIVINPGALTHYSIALRDALAMLPERIRIVEVHLSNIHARESFRHTSLTAAAADGVVAGVGGLGYLVAIDICIELLSRGGEG